MLAKIRSKLAAGESDLEWDRFTSSTFSSTFGFCFSGVRFLRSFRLKFLFNRRPDGDRDLLRRLGLRLRLRGGFGELLADRHRPLLLILGGEFRRIGDRLRTGDRLYLGLRLLRRSFGDGDLDRLRRYLRATGEGERDHRACFLRANMSLFMETKAAERGDS